MTETIPLNRQFKEWSKEDPSDPELLSLFGHTDRGLAWDDLLTRSRVVILAEAGSGKSEELSDRSGRQRQAGKFAFYATVHDVAQDGLADALPPADRPVLEEWRQSDNPGWFFIDSVDEAKLDGIQLDRALRRLATAILGAEGRAHIVLSGRFTDWESRRDLARLEQELPIPAKRTAPAPPLSPEDLVIRAIRHERPKQAEESVERPLIVAMLSLDRNRIRMFAEAKGVTNFEAFLAQIESNNLWRFARRPLDLEWMVQFWRTEGRLGSLSEMLENSLRERLREPNPGRGRRDPLDIHRASAALERIGAALAMTRVRTITIPDPTVTLLDEAASLDLGDVLPDWPENDRPRLLSRPVFDPATFGRARLHNDNEGVVSAFLTARWIQRLRAANLPLQTVFDLLFADTYGLSLIKPSMRETAAWLAGTDQAVAQEVFRRDPFLLLSAGDPARLPVELRRAVLVFLTDAFVEGAEPLFPDQDGIRRFARPDIAGTVCDLWDKYSAHAEARRFLLRIVWLGELKGCAELAAAAAFSEYQDNGRTALPAGRALLATADDNLKKRYAGHITARLDTERAAVLWDAIDGLFPALLSVADFLAILAAIDVTGRDGAIGLEWDGPKLVQRLDSQSDLEHLLTGLLSQLGGPPALGHIPNQREQAYFPIIGAAAHRLLALGDPDAPPTIAIDAALRLGAYRHDHHARDADKDLTSTLRRTAASRRAAFWRAGECLSSSHPFQNGPIESVLDMSIAGWSPGLKLEDVAWLLADAPHHTHVNEKRLIIDAAVEAWREGDALASSYEQIAAVAQRDPVMQQTLQKLTTPRTPSAEEIESRRALDAATEHAHSQRNEHEDSWKQFTADIRANPAQLRELRPLSPKGVDSRLFHLWQLLQTTESNSSRYAIESVAPLEPLIGHEAASAVRDGLIGLWRAWAPRLKSSREEGKRNQIGSIDCMGIAGVTLEARQNPNWADRLTSEEARRAAAYATLELNGFPPWISQLAKAWPREVSEVLMGEIMVEIERSGDAPRAETLEDSNRAEPPVAQLLAEPLFAELRNRTTIPPPSLPPLLGIITRGLVQQDRAAFVDLVLDRFRTKDNPETAAAYLSAAFALDPRSATDRLLAKLNTLPGSQQTLLMQAVLPRFFGDRMFRHVEVPANLPLESLEQLIIASYRTIRIDEDRNRPSGVVYSPDARDDAERARGAAFQILAEMPGRATFEALNRFADTPDSPIRRTRVLELAWERAAKDSEGAPWRPRDPFEFEQTFETAPSTPADLQRVARSRLADMQHELLHSDFAQGQTLAGLRDERAVQNWLADRLHLKEGRSYSVERESHVVDENEPDIRLRSKVTDASLPVEVKVAESWTITQLEEALVRQLCEQYLRADNARHGILLLVHQKRRNRGWQLGDEFLTFSQVVAHLVALAAQIAGQATNAPQPEIAVFDVSAATGRARTKKKQKATKKSAEKFKTAKNVTAKKAARKPTRKKAAGRRAALKNAVQKKAPKGGARKRRPNTSTRAKRRGRKGRAGSGRSR